MDRPIRGPSSVVSYARVNDAKLDWKPERRAVQADGDLIIVSIGHAGIGIDGETVGGLETDREIAPDLTNMGLSNPPINHPGRLNCDARGASVDSVVSTAEDDDVSRITNN